MENIPRQRWGHSRCEWWGLFDYSSASQLATDPPKTPLNQQADYPQRFLFPHDQQKAHKQAHWRSEWAMRFHNPVQARL
jgi:hypothetical protein